MAGRTKKHKVEITRLVTACTLSQQTILPELKVSQECGRKVYRAGAKRVVGRRVKALKAISDLVVVCMFLK